jgi:hypothetical protein
MLATRLARYRKAFRFGVSLSSTHIAKEIVPVVLRRPMLVKVGLAASAMTVCNDKAWCVESGGLFDDFLDDLGDLMEVDGSAEPVTNDPDAAPDAEADDEADDGKADGEDDEEDGEKDFPEAEADAEPGFAVGAPVMVSRAGKWIGTVTAIGAPENFLQAGKFQVKYAHQSKKGRGFTTTTLHAWVGPRDLEQCVLSPQASPAQKAQRTATETTAEPRTTAARNSR